MRPNSSTPPAGGTRSRSFGEHHAPPHQATQRLSAPAPEIADQLDDIAGLLHDVDERSSRRLRDLATALTTESGRFRWSDVDLRRAFNTDRLSHAWAVHHEGGYAPAAIEIADKIRNVLVLVPILLTWAALGEAANSYARFVEQNPDERDTPFLVLWQRGFDGDTSWFSPTFSAVALVDALIIAIIIILTLYAHGRREKQEDQIADSASQFQADFDNALAEATVLLATDRSSRPVQLADSVERLVDGFEVSSQNLLNQLQAEHDRLDHLAARREKEFADFGVFASGMRAGAEEMHRLLVDLRQVSSGLERALEDLGSDVSRTGDQQRSLLTAVSNLERLTSSAIQNDQAATRQIAQAAARLAETADKAISGAESATQAGRVALDAVRGISSVAQDIAASQSRVDRALTAQQDASTALAESLRANTAGAAQTAQQLTEIGGGLTHLQEEFDRIAAAQAQQIASLNNLLGQQAETAREISQVARELGTAGITTTQRQREVNQTMQHLVQRLDSLANTLNRQVQQTPNVENLQAAFAAALRAELNRAEGSTDDPQRTPGRWARSRS